MCGGRKTQGREMRRQWEKSARFFVGFFFCLLLLLGFLFFFFFVVVVLFFFLEGAWERK